MIAKPSEKERPVNNLWPTEDMVTGAIIDLMSGGDGAYGTTEIAERIRAPYNRVRYILLKMERQGLIKGKTLGTSNNQRIWWIV